ncbi:hypothetical protein UY3_02905 [Chelonia mydas]|uniref:Uncharacterized protein n=1 Tax=Chelonia mydas TaxID=8469 RepID=M7BPQ7_CHEMY|nr:hypothetical protein UY3_02905 [Chelonia mydas]
MGARQPSTYRSEDIACHCDNSNQLIPDENKRKWLNLFLMAIILVQHVGNPVQTEGLGSRFNKSYYLAHFVSPISWDQHGYNNTA